MPTTTEILRHLTRAELHIAEAKELVAGTTPTPPGLAVAVHNGDNLLAMIADHPEHTVFDVADDFIQDMGYADLAKPCTLRSRQARVIACMSVKPGTHLIGMTIDGANSDTILTAADDLTLDACVLNGNLAGQHRGILVNARGIRIRTTKILNIARDIDTQAIAGWNRTADLQVVACHLEASGENLLIGGDSSESPETMPHHIAIRGCYFSKRPEWRNAGATCKNLIELKVGDTVDIRDNVLDYSFVDGQAGYGLVMTVRNEYGTTPWSAIRNVTVINNRIRHVAAGIHILGRDDRNQSQVMTNVTIADNTIEDLASTYGGNGRQIMIMGGPDKLTISGNAFHCPTKPNSALCFDQPQYLCTNLVVKDQEQFTEGEYGIFGTSAPALGTAAIEMYAPGYTWTNNRVLKSGSNITWPAGTVFI